MAQYALIAEFDPQRAAIYRKAVESQHLEAVLVRDGVSAKSVLQHRGAPLLLIADLSLPQTDGFSLIAELRRTSPPERTAILVFSAFADLRAAAWDLRGSLGISEVSDKNLPPETITNAVIRALATVQRSDLAGSIDREEPDELFRKIMHRTAKAFHVPIVLLSLEFREKRVVLASIGMTELRSVPHQWPVLQQVITTREPMIVPDVTKHSLFGIETVTPALPVQAFATVPLITSGNQLIGAMSLLDIRPLTLTAPQVDLLMGTARRIADEVQRRYPNDLVETEQNEHQRVEEKWAALERLALTDPLTGLSNRRAGERALEREVARARRASSPFSLALLDLDHFKQINDRHGHVVGDQVLCELSRILTTTFRASDLAVRWGGDEFLVLLPDVNLSGAIVFAERARLQLESLPFPEVGRLTMSAGIVEIKPDEDPRGAIARADAQLYAAKGAGRNQVKGA